MIAIYTVYFEGVRKCIAEGAEDAVRLMMEKRGLVFAAQVLVEVERGLEVEFYGCGLQHGEFKYAERKVGRAFQKNEL